MLLKTAHKHLPAECWNEGKRPDGSFFSPLIFLQDATEEDTEAELAIIHGQMAYIMQLQGRTEDALQLYNQIIKLK